MHSPLIELSFLLPPILIISTYLVHALASEPVQEGLATEHDAELVGDTLEDLLDSR